MHIYVFRKLATPNNICSNFHLGARCSLSSSSSLLGTGAVEEVLRLSAAAAAVVIEVLETALPLLAVALRGFRIGQFQERTDVEKKDAALVGGIKGEDWRRRGYRASAYTSKAARMSTLLSPLFLSTFFTRV
jgi:hypothetical protein